MAVIQVAIGEIWTVSRCVAQSARAPPGSVDAAGGELDLVAQLSRHPCPEDAPARAALSLGGASCAESLLPAAVTAMTAIGALARHSLCATPEGQRLQAPAPTGFRSNCGQKISHCAIALSAAVRPDSPRAAVHLACQPARVLKRQGPCLLAARVPQRRGSPSRISAFRLVHSPSPQKAPGPHSAAGNPPGGPALQRALSAAAALWQRGLRKIFLISQDAQEGPQAGTATTKDPGATVTRASRDPPAPSKAQSTAPV